MPTKNKPAADDATQASAPVPATEATPAPTEAAVTQGPQASADASQVTTAADPAAADGEATPVSDDFTVRCARPQGIWRAGRFWPAEKTPANVNDFTDAQLDALLAEPLLVVTFAPE